MIGPSERRRSRPRLRLRRGAAILVTGALLAGCSGSGGDDAPEAEGAGPTTSAPPPCRPAEDVSGWPLAERAARLVVVPVLDFDLTGIDALAAEGFGGVLFLGTGAPPTDLADQLDAVLAGAPHGRPQTMADEEGGGVQRLDGLVDEIPWARTLGASLSADGIRTVGSRLGAQLLEAGIDTDLAPVLDVDGGEGPSATNPAGRRSFGATAELATTAGLAFADGLEEAGVLPVVKHFPGLGGATANTDDAPAATVSLDELREEGLRPFVAAIESGVPAIMVANATVPGLTDEPATLSKAAVQDLLRDELGFTGLVVSDSLSAGAISATGLDLPEAAVASVAAGVDQILFGAVPGRGLDPAAVAETARAMAAALEAAVADGTLTEARIDEAVGRILATGSDVCPPDGD